MIDRSALPRVSEVLDRLGVPPGRHNRTQCPIHQGDNRSAFKYDDETGTWYCFRCGVGGDVIRLIELALDTDFKGALRWLGIEPGKPPTPDPGMIRLRKAKDGFRAWVKKTGRAWREDFYQREMTITSARKILERDPENAEAWDRLATALHGHAALEHKLDCINGSLEEQAEIYKFMRGTNGIGQD
jgi:DNA primase